MMRKYLTEYLKKLEALLASGEDTDYEKLLRSHLTMIQFMQHERLIHFLVTILFAVCFFIVLAIYVLGTVVYMIPLMVLILGLLIPYIAHYYFLENSVQKMYFLHDEILKRRDAQQQAEATRKER